MLTFYSKRLSAKRKKITILVVEPDLVVSRCLYETISSLEFVSDVHVARDETEAEATLARKRVDAVVIDPAQLDDPARDAELMLDSKHLQCIFFTSMDRCMLGLAMARRGFSEFVYKTEGCGGLVKAIERMFDLNQKSSGGARFSLSSKLAALSLRERQTVIHLGHGLTLKEAAVRMNVNPKTVETYKNRAFSKLGMSSRADLVSFVAFGQAPEA